jgi:hypothetical protein
VWRALIAAGAANPYNPYPPEAELATDQIMEILFDYPHLDCLAQYADELSGEKLLLEQSKALGGATDAPRSTKGLLALREAERARREREVN